MIIYNRLIILVFSVYFFVLSSCVSLSDNAFQLACGYWPQEPYLSTESVQYIEPWGQLVAKLRDRRGAYFYGFSESLRQPLTGVPLAQVRPAVWDERVVGVGEWKGKKVSMHVHGGNQLTLRSWPDGHPIFELDIGEQGVVSQAMLGDERLYYLTELSEEGEDETHYEFMVQKNTEKKPRSLYKALHPIKILSVTEPVQWLVQQSLGESEAQQLQKFYWREATGITAGESYKLGDVDQDSLSFRSLGGYSWFVGLEGDSYVGSAQLKLVRHQNIDGSQDLQEAILVLQDQDFTDPYWFVKDDQVFLAGMLWSIDQSQLSLWAIDDDFQIQQRHSQELGKGVSLEQVFQSQGQTYFIIRQARSAIKKYQLCFIDG